MLDVQLIISRRWLGFVIEYGLRSGKKHTRKQEHH
jgi:hypothetical protein